MKEMFSISQNIVIFSLLMLSAKLSLCSNPTIVPANPFDDEVVTATANALYSLYLTEGKGTEMLEILTSCTMSQRKVIEDKYNFIHRGRTCQERIIMMENAVKLADDGFSQIPGFSTELLFLSKEELYAKYLDCAMVSWGTNEDNLIRGLVMLSKSVQLKNDTRNFYQAKYGDLMKNVEKETSGNFRDVLLSILKTDRKPDTKKVDIELAKTLAETLHNAAELGDNGINNITTILFETPFNVLEEVVLQFKEKYNGHLHEFLDDKYDGDLGETFRQGACLAYDEALHSAILLRRAMKGPGTDDNTVLFLLFIESETCLQDVKNKYYEMYGINLVDRLLDDFSYDEVEFLKRILGSDQPKSVNLWDIPAVRTAGGR